MIIAMSDATSWNHRLPMFTPTSYDAISMTSDVQTHRHAFSCTRRVRVSSSILAQA
jgi:hypothetical protein